MLSYMDHYMGMDAKTCSYTAKFISDNAAKAKTLGQSEVQYRNSLVQGHMGFLSGKWYGEQWDAGKVIMRAKFDNEPVHGKFTWSWTDKGTVKQREILNGQEYDSELTWQQFDAFMNKALNDPNYSVSVPALRPPAVSPSSNSIGALTDEDAAILFVKTKDEFAKAKGVNIQGANPALDLEVYESVAKATGYTQNEIRLKIEAYKATGKKLSALKKQVLAGKKTVKLPDPVEVKPDPIAEVVKEKTGTEAVIYDNKLVGTIKEGTAPVSEAGKSYSYAKQKVWNTTTYKKDGTVNFSTSHDSKNAAKQHIANWQKKEFETSSIEQQEKDWFSMVNEKDISKPKKGVALEEHKFGDTDGWKVTYNGNDIGALTEVEPGGFFGTDAKGVQYVFDPKGKNGKWDSAQGPYGSLTEAKQAAENWGKKEFADAPDLAQPPEVHVEPSTAAVKEAVADLKAKDATDALIYADEDIVKAYIKAKDHVAAQEQNIFTLYSKGPDFDNAIRKQMSLDLNTSNLSQQQINKAIANYLGSGQKISVLKKKMIKSGEMKPQADTLKTKGEGMFTTGKVTTHAEAEAQIKAAAEAVVEPVGSGVRHVFNEGQKDNIFADLKNSIYAGSSPQQTYTYFYNQALKYEKLTGDKVSALDIIRIYDQRKAKQLGIENGFFYEKKITEWASTPTGQNAIYTIKNAEKIALEKEAKAKAAEGLINKDIPDLPADSAKFEAITNAQARAMQNGLEPWTPSQKGGLQTYTGGAYTDMNQYQRGKSSYISDSYRTAVNNAQKGMRPVDRDIFVMRGCDYRQFDLGEGRMYSFDPAMHLEVKSLVGQEIQDKAFTSASVKSNNGTHASAFGGSVRLEIEVPRGTYGAFVDHISKNQGENEFIMAAGTHYKVLQVTKQGNQTVVRVRAIPGTHRKANI